MKNKLQAKGTKECPKTITGRHKWTGGNLEEEYMAFTHTTVPISKKDAISRGCDFWEGKPYKVPEKYIEKECVYCGIIDDRKHVKK